VEALFEVGKQRQALLGNLRKAFESNDLEGVLTYSDRIFIPLNL
jgi:hypothetical protein